ncbi:MAG: hypothetical protein HY020_25185 [Burkholderiales bacterium]|nr:hypothetical protein [Burkholderiales bacterium]
MSATSVLEAGSRTRAFGPQVVEWAFDQGAGQITARDGQGRVLMAIVPSPLFGPRLAAAFAGSTASTMHAAGWTNWPAA